MALVEYLLVAAADVGVSAADLEESVERRFTTVRALARALTERALTREARCSPAAAARTEESKTASPARDAVCWLAATSVRLAHGVQTAAEVDALLARPSGWFASHTGIQERRLWRDGDPLGAAAGAARDCVQQAGLDPGAVDVLLVTSEAPPLLVGLAAAVHDRLGLSPATVALEMGGACTGFLAALWLGRALLARRGSVLIVAVEAPSRLLEVKPGPSGEAAALFGDGAAACLLCRERSGPQPFAVRDVRLSVDGSQRELVQVQRSGGAVEVRLHGTQLAALAIETMAREIETLAGVAAVAVDELGGIVIHGGNGRFSDLVAHRLGVPAERIRSQTPRTGNLGSASVPVAWATHLPERGPVIWAAIGAGVTWGAALLEHQNSAR
jgi:3-oxoacyl-[acyl-carrier-protein] synthase-3